LVPGWFCQPLFRAAKVIVHDHRVSSKPMCAAWSPPSAICLILNRACPAHRFRQVQFLVALSSKLRVHRQRHTVIRPTNQNYHLGQIRTAPRAVSWAARRPRLAPYFELTAATLHARSSKSLVKFGMVRALPYTHPCSTKRSLRPAISWIATFSARPVTSTSAISLRIHQACFQQADRTLMLAG